MRGTSIMKELNNTLVTNFFLLSIFHSILYSLMGFYTQGRKCDLLNFFETNLRKLKDIDLF